MRPSVQCAHDGLEPFKDFVSVGLCGGADVTNVFAVGRTEEAVVGFDEPHLDREREREVLLIDNVLERSEGVGGVCDRDRVLAFAVQDRPQGDGEDLGISDDPFQSQSAGIAFSEPIPLGATGAELSIKPSLTGSLSITKGPTLFSTDTDAFREVIPIPAQQAYLSAALTAEVDLAIAGKVTDLQFGFTAGTTIVLTNYRLCA